MVNGHTIVVSGTPGTGKTRFGRLLARKLGVNSINMTEFARQHNLIKSYDRTRRTYVVDERRLQRELEKYLTSLKERVVVDGHYSGSLVPTRVIDVVFVLRCSPEILRKRLRRRGYPEAKIGENIEAEVLDICLSEAVATHGLEKVAEIDMSARRVEDCVEEALLILAKKRPRQIGKCDWLAELERKGRLDKFLKEQAVSWKRDSS